MSLEQQKVFKTNFLPSRLRKSFPIYNEQFNDLIDAIKVAIAAVGGAPVPGAPHITDTVNEFTPGAGVTIDGVRLKDGAVKYATGGGAQASLITDGVTINKPAGNATTVVATLAADTSATFTLTNSFLLSNSVVVATIANYSGVFGVNGLPVVSLDNRQVGSIDIVVSNAHPTNPLNGTILISYVILSS